MMVDIRKTLITVEPVKRFGIQYIREQVKSQFDESCFTFCGWPGACLKRQHQDALWEEGNPAEKLWERWETSWQLPPTYLVYLVLVYLIIDQDQEHLFMAFLDGSNVFQQDNVP